jgi:1-acyl-sn-glycerol-3-phosphate acyltransferase
VLLTRLGIERLWGGGPEGAYPFMSWWVKPITVDVLSRSYAYGADRVPPSGGAVLAANHLSALDPPLVGSLSPRAVWFMMKAELGEMPLFGEALTWTGAFPIRRGESDREGVRRARDLVRDGHVVGIFPEGTRQRLGYPGPVQPGAAMISMQEGVPLIPCGLDSFGWSIRNRRACCVVFGEAVDLADLPRKGPGYREGALRLERELLRLWRMACEAIAADFPEQLSDGSRRSGRIKPGEGYRTDGAIRNVSALRSSRSASAAERSDPPARDPG